MKEEGRKKSVVDPRRIVNCPESKCNLSGRIDNVKKHFKKLLVWSKTFYEDSDI